MARGFNISVNIGAKLLPSLNSAAGAVERRFRQMNQRLRVQAAETKIAYKEMTTAIKPLAAMAAAGGLSFGLKDIFGKGADYAHEIAMLRVAGRTSTEVAQAIAQANKTLTEVPTSTLSKNLAIINETTGAFGNFHHALENLTFNSKFGYMMTNMLGMDASEVPHALNSAVQALEIRGTAMDSTKYRSDMSALFKAMVFTKGRFNPEELMGFAKTGNLALKQYNQHFLSRVMPSLITELGGGDVVGTQAAAFRNQIMGRVPLGGKKLVQEWVRLGLVPKPGTGGNNSRTGWTAGTVKGHALAMSDPFKWIETVMLPAMRSKGINTNDSNAVLLQVAKMFGRETAMRFVATMADPRQRKRLHKDERMIGGAMPLDKSYELMLATDPNAAYAKMMAKFDTLSTRLGALFTVDVIRALNLVADGVNALGDAVTRHPMLGKIAVYAMGFGAFAASLAVLRISLKFLFSPLKSLWKLLFTAGPRQIGVVGWILRGLSRIGIVLVRVIGGLGARVGPLLLRGLMVLGPWILRGIAAAFGLLSNPVGWAILAASAALLIWKYRAEIAKAWAFVVDWFANSAWPAIKATGGELLNWGSGLVSSMISGLAKAWPALKTWFATKWRETMPTWMGGAPAVDTSPTPKIDGARARGGSVSAGGVYRINEKGEEAFVPGRSGTIIPAHVVNALRQQKAGGGGVNIGQVHIHGANDPQSTRRILHEELRKLAVGQNALLSD